jgi:hypothetical protein
MKTPKKIMDSARNEQCTLNISGVCNYDTDTVVYCHFADGSGGSNKLTGPLHGGYGCSSCHDSIDGRVLGFNQLTKVDREFYMRRSMNRTINRLIEKGLVVIKGLK